MHLCPVSKELDTARTPNHAQVVNDVGLPSLPASVTRALRVPVVCEPGQFACNSDVCRDGEWRSIEQGMAHCPSIQVLMGHACRTP